MFVNLLLTNTYIANQQVFSPVFTPVFTKLKLRKGFPGEQLRIWHVWIIVKQTELAVNEKGILLHYQSPPKHTVISEKDENSSKTKPPPFTARRLYLSVGLFRLYGR